MTMIERAARAIAEALGDKLDNVPVNKREWLEERGMFDGAFRDINMPFRSDYEDAARAVLLAIREPSEAQIDRFVSRALCVTVHGDGGWSNYAREQWHAMIDEALKEAE